MNTGFCRRLVVPVVWVLLILAIAPALWHSLHTPFTLVDDHGDWGVLNWNRYPGSFRAWARDVFLGCPQRYRPFFEFYNWITWRVFLDQAAMHHLARWLVAMATLAFGLRALRSFIAWRSIAALALVAGLILLYPNQPVARLAPQELNCALFLAIEVLAVARLLRSPDFSLAGSGTGTIALLVIGFAGLSMTKETNLLPMAWILLWLIAAHGRPFTWRAASVLVTLTVIGAYTFWRVMTVKQGGGYGTASLSLDLLHRNAGWLLGEAFQANTSWIITAGLLIPGGAVAMRLLRCALTGVWFCDDRFLLFLFGILGAVMTAALTSWLPVLRYWHPLVLPIALLAAAGWCFIGRTRFGRRPLPVAALLSAWLLYFAAANYANFLFQFSIRRHAGEVDQTMLNGVAALLRAGESVAICYSDREPEIEMALHARGYFTRFLPYFRGENPPALMKYPPDEGHPPPLLVSPRTVERGMTLAAVYGADDRYPLFRAACRVGAFLQGRPECHLACDGGAKDLDYAWRLWRPAPSPTDP
jgi:hypothetical protein